VEHQGSGNEREKLQGTKRTLSETHCPPLTVNGPRLLGDLTSLAEIGKTSQGGVSRPAFSEADRLARTWLEGKMTEAGLRTRVDTAGNIFGRLGAEGPAVLAGSHIDSVPDGGRFDGVLGVLAALECARTIREAGIPLRHAVEVVAFSDEEERFVPFLGSSALLGAWTADGLEAVRDAHEVRLVEAMRACGLAPEQIAEAILRPTDIVAFLELHIEQGPILDTRGVPVGLVTAIKGDHRHLIQFSGRADHAGTTPMDMRCDALRPAAELIDRLPALVQDCGDQATVGTVGVITVRPSRPNIVPQEAEVIVDVRDARPAVLARLEQALRQEVARLGADHKVGTSIQRIMEVPPTRLDAGLGAVIREACRERDLPFLEIESGAGHDAQVLAPKVPTAMIFVPSRAGRSHSPEEYTSPEHVVAGAEVLLGCLLRLTTEFG